jgi:hypothetical protein
MVPTKSATKASRLAVDPRRRSPTCAITPWFITTDAVGHRRALLLVVRHHDGGDARGRRCQRLDLVRAAAAHRRASSAESGLVEQQQAGRGRSARAPSATRCCWPPDSCTGIPWCPARAGRPSASKFGDACRRFRGSDLRGG